MQITIQLNLTEFLKKRKCPNCGQLLGPPGSAHVCS